MRRRSLLLSGVGGGAALAAVATLPTGCGRTATPGDDEGRAIEMRWVGIAAERGHLLRAAVAGTGAEAGPRADAHASPSASMQARAGASSWPAPARRVGALVLGGGVAGLAAARALSRRGIDDVHLLELEDAVGGNARAHAMGGLACPLGAHYLPLPGPEAREVSEWLHEIGLLRTDAAGRVRADERHLCHSPQERLFFEGQWVEGLLPPAPPGSRRLAQYRRFAALVAAQQRLGGGGRPAFSLPAHRSAWTPALAALDAVPFATWLAREGIDDDALRAYLDYCCRDDYGAGLGEVSAWAGLHYFASRHGFSAPFEGAGEGREGREADHRAIRDADHQALGAGHGAGPGATSGEGPRESPREGVFTWPEGNGWLTRRLADDLGEARLHRGRIVLAVREARHAVAVLAADAHSGALQAWEAGLVVVALPVFVAARVVQPAASTLQAALAAAARTVTYAPWLVANLLLDKPLLDRAIGAPPAWDNVVHGSRGLGYVDASHQALAQPGARPVVLTAYHALPAAERAALLQADPRPWGERVLADLVPVHPDLRRRVQRIDLARYGHAMAVPRPGLQRHPALAALRGARGRLRFAHADLAGYSVFEEAFTAGHEAGS